MAITTEPLEIAQLRHKIITKEMVIQLMYERLRELEEKHSNLQNSN